MGSITVSGTPACAAAAASSTPTLTVNTVLTNITHTTTSATGIGTASGLPTGVTAAWSSNTITISGTPSVTGTFNYTIPLTGTSCSGVNATGTITVSAPSFTCGTSTISDIDNNSYNTVLIGTQCWTKENLRVRRYNDGTELRFDISGGNVGNSSSTWSGTGLKYGAYTLYAHDSMTSPSNFTNYGYLYNWYAVAGIITDGGNAIKNICPTGWHVPTDGEWTSLIQFIVPTETVGATVVGSQSPNAGGKLKSTTLWNTATPPSPGTDNFFFTALPGGARNNDGRFTNIRNVAFFWSATESDYSNAWFRSLLNNYSDVHRASTLKSVGASVRCLRD
jgi:uncharacterized protein (TIGR02145 family)